MLKSQCRCDSCAPDNPDPRATEAFRHECEVRSIANMESHADRRRFLGLVEKHRGKATAEALRNDVARAMGIIR